MKQTLLALTVLASLAMAQGDNPRLAPLPTAPAPVVTPAPTSPATPVALGSSSSTVAPAQAVLGSSSSVATPASSPQVAPATPAPTSTVASPAPLPSTAVAPAAPAPVATPVAPKSPAPATSTAPAAPAPTPVATPAPAPKAPASAPAVAPASAPKTSAPAPSVAPASAPAVAKTSAPSDSSASSASSAAPVTAAAGAGTEAQAKSDSGSTAPAAESSSVPKTGMSGSVAVGLITVGDEQLTRISFRPEFSLGSFGVALDLELFVASDGRIMTRGWEFDTKDQTINSLYRKIYYVRWNQPGDGFYIRAGALEGITMDAAGLVTQSWGNVAQYPGQKLVGVHVQFNDWLDPWGVSLEVANNSLEDWNHGGGVLAGKVSAKPLGILGLPLISNLKVGAMAIRDFNQFATIPDKDGDNCPDAVDEIDGDGCKYLKSFVNADSLEEYYTNRPDQLISWLDRSDSARNLAEQQITDRFGNGDDFTMIAFDYTLPLITSDLLNLGIYGEYARPWLDKDPFDLNDAWGLVPIGVAMKVWKLDMGIEYRRIKGPFQVGHFNNAYEMDRVRFMNGEYLTKEQNFWEASQTRGTIQGVYGRANFDVFGMADLNGSYYHLMGKNDFKDRGYTGKASVGKTLLDMIPKISLLEAYYNKDHLYMDNDDFFDLSIYTTHGYRIGFDLGGGMTVIVGSMTTYSRNSDDELEPTANFVAETVVTF